MYGLLQKRYCKAESGGGDNVWTVAEEVLLG